MDAASCSYQSDGSSKIRTLTIQHCSNGSAAHGGWVRLVRVWLQLDLLVSHNLDCARGYRNRFVHATTEDALSLFSALNIFLFHYTVMFLKAQRYE